MPLNAGAWARESRERIASEGFRGALNSAYYAYAGSLLEISARRPLGTNVFDRDWDLLVVLDACRVDALREVADEYEFLEAVDSIWSVGSTTVEWMAHTFRSDYLSEIRATSYVCGNVQIENVLDHRRALPHIAAAPVAPSIETYDLVDTDDFGALDRAYEYGFDDALGTVPPRPITDRTISAGRAGETPRVIAHYLQPHAPYIAREDPPADVFDALRSGALAREEVWEMYLDTLRLVLDDVAELLRNYDAETVAITADHGEAFGEWTFHSHNVACPHAVVRKVPWAVCSASDDGTRTSEDPAEEALDVDTEAQLEHLGYL